MERVNDDDFTVFGMAGFTVRLTDEHRRVLRFINNYGGVPLSCTDVHEELKMCWTHANSLLLDLKLALRLSTCRGPGGTWLYYTGRKL